IAGRIHQKNLRAAWPAYDVIAEAHPRRPQSSNLRDEVGDDEMDAIPTARARTLAVGHRPAGRTGWPADQQSQRSKLDVGKCRRVFGEERKAEMPCVPLHSDLDVVDHVSNVDGSRVHWRSLG